MKEKIKKLINTIPKTLLGLFGAILIMVLPLTNGKVALGHDIDFHMTNYVLTKDYIDIFKLNIFLPRVFSGGIANGFGYGTGIFYPPLSFYLSAYTSSILEAFNLSSNNTITCVEIPILVFAGIFMYMLILEIFKDHKVSLIGSISYITSTYLMCDLYVRAALAELLVFVFIPIVFLGLYDLFFKEGKKFKILFVIGYTGMILSHLVLTVYLTIIIILLFLLNIKKVIKKDKIKSLLIASLIVLLLTSPYYIPILEHKINGSYIVFEQNGMYSLEQIKNNALTLDSYINKNSIIDGIKMYLNQVVLILLIITIIFNKKIFIKENRKIFNLSLIIIGVSIFISSTYFPWDKTHDFMKMIQFPWRMLTFVTFGISLLVGNIVKLFDSKNKTVLTVFISVLIVLISYNEIPKHTAIVPNYIDCTDMGVQKEYLPTNTSNNINYFISRNNDIKIRKGTATIELIEVKTPNIKANINTNEVITVELPALYYLGYNIELINEKEETKKLNYYENEYGFIELEIPESGILQVEYKNTTGGIIAKYIALITILVIFIINIVKRKKFLG